MENDEIQYIIKNSTFIKNNLLNKVDDNLNLLMIIFVILNEEDKNNENGISDSAGFLETQGKYCPPCKWNRKQSFPWKNKERLKQWHT